MPFISVLFEMTFRRRKGGEEKSNEHEGNISVVGKVSPAFRPLSSIFVARSYFHKQGEISVFTFHETSVKEKCFITAGIFPRVCQSSLTFSFRSSS